MTARSARPESEATSVVVPTVYVVVLVPVLDPTGFGLDEVCVVAVEVVASVPKEIVVDATGVGTTERVEAGAGVKTEPR